jgi:uncharacterized protein (DUF849 family)
MTTRGIACEAAACAAAGAHVIHVHVRDTAGNHVLDAAAYRDVTDAIRGEAGDALVVQITTEAVGRYSRHDQMALVRELRPQAVSIALRELMPDTDAEAEGLAFLAWCADVGIGVQHIVYDAADTARLVKLASGQHPHALFVLGRYATSQRATPSDLLPFLEQWPASWPWTACAFGPYEAACLADALALGGHVRVGFENNLMRPDGTLAASNAEQVAYVRDLALRGHRRLATAADARAIYGLTS